MSSVIARGAQNRVTFGYRAKVNTTTVPEGHCSNLVDHDERIAVKLAETTNVVELGGSATGPTRAGKHTPTAVDPNESIFISNHELVIWQLDGNREERVPQLGGGTVTSDVAKGNAVNSDSIAEPIPWVKHG
ncbi:hypothetical protein [Gemmatimonas sp.]|uniref:hypothetical protein n=1 Tax=Gemmatimonas sp. TaxID=1962908 RepID=UPI0039838886